MKEEENKGTRGGCLIAILAIFALCGRCDPIVKIVKEFAEEKNTLRREVLIGKKLISISEESVKVEEHRFANDSAKATEGNRSSEGHYGWIYGVRAVGDKAEKNVRGAIERDSVESSLIGETPLYPVNIRKGKMKRNTSPIIGVWEATINEEDSIRVVNLNIVSKHTIYSTGLTGKCKLCETWMSSDGNRYTYYDGNEKINVEVLSISWDTLCAFLSVGDEIAVIPFSRRKI